MKLLNKIFFKGSFYKNVSKLLSTGLIIQIIAFSLSPIISRLYTASDFGKLAIFMSIAGFFILFASFRFELALILPNKDEEAHALVKLSFLINASVSLLSFLIIYFFKEKIGNYYKITIPNSWIFLVPLVVFFSTSFYILLNYYNRLKNYNKQASAQFILGVGNNVSTIILAMQNGFHNGMIKAVFLSNFFSSLFMFPVLIKNKVFSTKVQLSTVFKKYKYFPFFNLPHAVLNFISNSLPVLLLTPAFGDASVGLFIMALGKVFKPINLFGSSIYQVLSKKIVDDIANKKPVLSHFYKLLKTLVLIGIVPFSLLFIFAPQIFSFIWGTQWVLSGVYLRYILPWLFFVYLTASVSFLPNVLKQQKNALKIEIIHLVLRFIALSVGVYFQSLKMALVLYSIVGVFMLSITLVWFLRIVKLEDQKNRY